MFVFGALLANFSLFLVHFVEKVDEPTKKGRQKSIKVPESDPKHCYNNL